MDELRDAGGLVDLGHPLDHAAEHLPVVDLLEGVALAAAAVDLPHKQHHRHAVLLGDVDAGTGVGGPGAAGDHGDAGPSGELAPGCRHHRGAALLTTDDEADLGRVVQRVQDLEIALARHAEDRINALQAELVDEDPAPGPGFARHEALSRWPIEPAA